MRESLSLWQGTGTPRDVACVRCTLARLERLRGRFDAARAALAESIVGIATIGERQRLARSLEEAAFILAAEGEWSHVASLMGAAEALRAVMAAPLPLDRRGAWKALEDRGREAAGAAVFEKARTRGEHLSEEEAAELAARLLGVP